MKSLNVSQELDLPAPIVTKTIAILGIRGAGKSNTAAVVAEEMLSLHLPLVVIDPTDSWWGLRSEFPVVIFGGSHGDIPLQETDGKIIAEFVVSEHAPVILSLRHLRKGAQRRFVADFCEEIYHLKGKDENRTALTVMIDEAPLFVPQKVMGEMARVVGAVEDLIARGRNSGFGVVLISQRSATINKDVLTQSDVIITHRLTSPQDKKALAEWFEDNASSDQQRDIFSSLATLPDGRAWIWAPTLKIMKQVQMRRRRTYDSGATPELGKAVQAPRKLTEIDLDTLRKRIGDTITKARENDPATLRKIISDLELKLKVESARAPAVSPVPTRVFALTEEQKAIVENIGEWLGWMRQAMEKPAQYLTQLDTAHAKFMRSIGKAPVVTPASPATDPVFRKIATLRPILSETNGNECEIGNGGKRRILTALAQYPSGMGSRKLSILTGISKKGGTWRTYLADLRSGGLVRGGSDAMTITEAGLIALGHFDPLPTGSSLRSYWLTRLGSGGRSSILKFVMDSYPTPVDYSTVSRQTSISIMGGTWRTYLAELRGLQLIESPGRGLLRACDDLFS